MNKKMFYYKPPLPHQTNTIKDKKPKP
jgi:hypothetical protein